jgi:hypothetical protein
MAPPSPFRFFNLDLHISVIADVKDILTRLYKDQVIVEDWSISGHTWVFKRQPSIVQDVNAHTWKRLDTAMVERFVQTYQNHLSKYDGFIVTHTPVFCRLFESFGKPIVMVNSCRYDQPYCMPGCYQASELDALNQCLRRLHARGQLIAISNNQADRDYLQLGAGVPSVHIPSLCLYTGIQHDPTRAKSTRLTISCTHKDCIPSSLPLHLKPMRYEWDDLMNRKGLVCIPYEVSTMSLFEHYSSGVPLFLPSKRFYKELIQSNKAVMSSYNTTNYWRRGQQPPALNATTDLDWWLDRCDFYDPANMPLIYYFDSWDALRQMAETFEYPFETLEHSRQHLRDRQATIESMWRTLLDPVIKNKNTQ